MILIQTKGVSVTGYLCQFSHLFYTFVICVDPSEKAQCADPAVWFNRSIAKASWLQTASHTHAFSLHIVFFIYTFLFQFPLFM